MKIVKKLLMWCLLFSCLPVMELKAKQKIQGILGLLFPLPTALYNAGCDGALDNMSLRGFQGSFFTVVSPEDIKVTFDDVAGLDAAKEDMQDVIAYLKDTDKFTKMGATVPKGILMNGDPGTGKTLLARAFAGQANCSFIHVNASEFCSSQYMGIGTQKIQELFRFARNHAPCIIFIDEIDAVGSKRMSTTSSGAADHNNTLTALLVEMDGFAENKKPIVIIAATNRVDQLDPAMKRPGRFDRIVEVTKPFIKDRRQLVHIACTKRPLDQNVNVDHIARITRGFSGAELVNLMNEAAILAVKDSAVTIHMKHVEMAYDNITLGREIKGMEQTFEGLWQTAIHEAGHLIGYLFQDKTVGVHKVSIVPRGKGLGVAHMLPLEELYDLSRQDLKNRIISALAGREAELSFGFDLSTGAANDLEQAQKIAYDMVVHYGMAENLRDMSYSQFDTELPSDVGANVYHEAKKIVDECRLITRKLIADHKKDIEKIAKLLMEKGTVVGEEIYQLLNLPQPKSMGLF